MIVAQSLFRCLLHRTTQRAISNSVAKSLSALSTTTPAAPRRNNHRLRGQKRSFHASPQTSHETEYYYDSQSGKHVPVHDESRVNIWLQVSTKNSDMDDVAQQVTAWARRGISGVVASHDATTLKVLYAAIQKAEVPETFQLWVKAAPVEEAVNNHAPNPVVVVHCVDYFASNDSDTGQTLDVVSNLVQQQAWTAITCLAEDDAMNTASGVASIIDATAGGDYVYLRGSDSDAMVELVEELAYLDVEGPTLKARMVVDLTTLNDDDDDDAETVEECLLAGINKYVVDEDRLPWLVEFVREQGKTCGVEISH